MHFVLGSGHRHVRDGPVTFKYTQAGISHNIKIIKMPRLSSLICCGGHVFIDRTKGPRRRLPPNVDPDLADARRKARQLIDNIAQDHTLNGTISGTKFELLANNCLEMYVLKPCGSVEITDQFATASPISSMRRAHISCWSSYKMQTITFTPAQLQP